MEVIEIFSSDEEDALTNDKTAAKNAAQDVFVLSIPGAWAGTPARSSAKPATSTKKNPPSKQTAEPSKHSSSGSPSRATREKARTATSAAPKQQKMAPLFADDSDESSDEVEAAPSFDGPRVHKAKTPVSRARETPKKQTRNPADEPRGHNTKTPSTSRTKTHPNEHESFSDADRDDDHAIMTINDPRSSRKPTKQPPHTKSFDYTPSPLDSSRKQQDASPSYAPASTVSSTSLISVTKMGSQAVRTNKKVQAAADLARRKEYADQLFKSLNATVFKNRLPAETKLNWSKRLTATAGRAKWHRSSKGVHTTEIELAEKILDCDERIRNTLSHEMCHLASWVINGNPKEGHGNIFKSWAWEVMQVRPEIEITTTHNYEISHPYRWECIECKYTYGRFSKSIKTEEVACGHCKGGRLRPLFETRKAPQTPKISRNAAAKPRDSPRSVYRPVPEVIELSSSSDEDRDESDLEAEEVDDDDEGSPDSEGEGDEVHTDEDDDHNHKDSDEERDDNDGDRDDSLDHPTVSDEDFLSSDSEIDPEGEDLVTLAGMLGSVYITHN